MGVGARHVALLYSVVLGPGRRVKSAELIHAAEACGWTGLRTVLSTGNLIFETGEDAGNERALSARLGAALAAEVGRGIPVHIRSAADFRALVAANPFPEESLRDPAHVAVRIMDAPVSADRVAELSAKCGAGERFAARDRALWVAVPTGLSDSALQRAVNAARTGAGTSRNASALAKIRAALDD